MPGLCATLPARRPGIHGFAAEAPSFLKKAELIHSCLLPKGAPSDKEEKHGTWMSSWVSCFSSYDADRLAGLTQKRAGEPFA